jgi:hypothetical protein
MGYVLCYIFLFNINLNFHPTILWREKGEICIYSWAYQTEG